MSKENKYGEPWHLGRVQYRHWRHSGLGDTGRNFKHPSGAKSYGVIILSNPGNKSLPNTIAELLESNFNLNYEENAKRIVTCVNAMAGIDDPEAFVMAATELADRVEWDRDTRDEGISTTLEEKLLSFKAQYGTKK